MDINYSVKKGISHEIRRTINTDVWQEMLYARWAKVQAETPRAVVMSTSPALHYTILEFFHGKAPEKFGYLSLRGDDECFSPPQPYILKNGMVIMLTRDAPKNAVLICETQAHGVCLRDMLPIPWLNE